MTAPADARLDITATYPDMEGARRAIDALQYGGIDPSQIRLLGAAADAARAADARKNTSDRDLPLVWRILWRGVLWSIVGAPAGALLGLALAFAGFIAINVWVTIALWALFGHLIGGMWGAYAALSIGDAWELTFHQIDGMPVVVAVRVESPGEAERVERMLRASAASAVASTPAALAAP